MNNTPSTTGTAVHETPEQRAEMIAGLRALADFLEAHPELPAPHGVSAQHSLNTLDADDELLIRRVADAFGVTPRFYEADGMPVGYVSYQVTGDKHSVYGATYTVHGMRRPDTAGGAA